jgi:hypothetical protein
VVGLIFLGIVVLWVVVATVISRYVAARFPASLRAIGGPIAFLCVLALPFLDEIIGRWQFSRLCATHAVVWVSPGAAKVEAAIDASTFRIHDGYVFPVREQISQYADAATNEPFLRVSSFHTPGGFVMRAGLNMGSSSSCWPERWGEPYRALELDKLLKRGKERT